MDMKFKPDTGKRMVVKIDLASFHQRWPHVPFNFDPRTGKDISQLPMEFCPETGQLMSDNYTLTQFFRKFNHAAFLYDPWTGDIIDKHAQLKNDVDAAANP